MTMTIRRDAPLEMAVGSACPIVRCRFCDHRLTHTFADLGSSPLAHKQITPDTLHLPEKFYPLHAWVCENCWLVQLPDLVPPAELFDEGFIDSSSACEARVKHAKQCEEALSRRFDIGEGKRVVEVGSNDGYLLQYFLQRQAAVLGIEPASHCTEAAARKGVATHIGFFGRRCAYDVADAWGRADLLLVNDVLACAHDLNDFVAGLQILLEYNGVLIIETQHICRLMEHNQFDSIYHEHCSYFSFITLDNVLATHGLTIFDVEEIDAHGGSLRVYARHVEDDSKPVGARVAEMKAFEVARGITELHTYTSFDEQIEETKRKVLSFLIEARHAGESTVCYGAPANGNTLLNYCGIRTDFIDYAVDRSPRKQGNFLPGSRIPIHPPDEIARTRPDYVLILDWNQKDEVMRQMSHVSAWGGKLVVAIPEVTVIHD